jgi:hypothetical protein
MPQSLKLNRLPKSFPVGTTYVVEGQGGEHGQLLVSSRYVVLPGGRIEIAADCGRSASCAVVGVLDGTGSLSPAGRAGAGLAVPAFSGSGFDVG